MERNSKPSRMLATAMLLCALAAVSPQVAAASPSGPWDAAQMLAARPVIDTLLVRTRSEAVTQAFTPGDTFYIDVHISSADGFGAIKRLDLLLDTSPNSAGTLRGNLRWNRDNATPWTQQSSGWTILPDLCSADTSLLTTAPARVRFAATPSLIAPASLTGAWSCNVSTSGAVHDFTGFGMSEYLQVVADSPNGEFEPGLAGSGGHPLLVPANGEIGLSIVSNTAWELRAALPGMTGVTDPAQRIRIRAADGTLTWTTPQGTGPLDSTSTTLLTSQAASTSAVGSRSSVALHLNLPAGLSSQFYDGTLQLGVHSTTGPASSLIGLPMRATIVGGGLAADSAIAEIQPTSVAAGSVGATFRLHVQPYLSGASTGVNRIEIGLPPGFSAPQVTAVTLWGISTPFTDVSTPDAAGIQLPTRITTAAPLQIRFAANVPARADTTGATFGVLLDDDATPLPPISARAGNANALVAGDRLDVLITAGALASLALSPTSATLDVGDSLEFAVASTDAFGNALTPSLHWSTEGGIGRIDTFGVFRATGAGDGRVIVSAEGISDTAAVTVEKIASGLTVRAIPLNAPEWIPGAETREVLRARIVNATALSDTLHTLDLYGAAIGAGTVSQYDSSWTSLSLHAVPAGTAAQGLASAISVTTFVSGVARFRSLELAVPAGDSVDIVAVGGVTVGARDGDRLGVLLPDASALEFLTGRVPDGAWPAASAGLATVNGMSSFQLRVARPHSSVTVGVRRRAAIELLVPSNGYQTDALRRINLTSAGDAIPQVDIEKAEAWADDGDARFDPSLDLLLGELPWTGERWELTGLSLPIPTEGRRIFVSVDVAETARQGRTIVMSLPTLPDVALGMKSGNSGPVDRAVTVPAPMVITVADRITVAADPLGGATATPGARDVPLMSLRLNNTYGTDRELTSLRVHDAAVGPGSVAELDREMGRLELRLDEDGDGVLGDPASHPVLSSASLTGGLATFTGFRLALPAGGSQRLFVTGRIALDAAADGDQLATSLVNGADLGFEPASLTAAAWPLVSANAPFVDGLVAAQVAQHVTSGATLGPWDGPVAALDVVIPRNGYLDDQLTGLRVVNEGSAGTSDVGELRLWRDGGDGRFDGPTGDDADLGPLSRIGNEWRSALLSEPVGAAGTRVFVSASVSGAPADSVSLRLAIPTGGISMASGNDGPLDSPIRASDALLFSTEPLLATLTLSPSTSVVGQSVIVRMRVRNVGSEAVTAIVPSPLEVEGEGGLTVQSGPAPSSASLEPGAETTLEWIALATAAGSVRLAAAVQGTGATSGLPRRSLVSRSAAHQVFVGAADVDMFAVQSMPFAVNRGQLDVVPLSLTFAHPGTADASDIRIRRLVLGLERQDGSPIAPADLVQALSVTEGATTYLERSSLEHSGGTATLELTRPIVVSPGNPVTIALSLDISALTTVPDFRLSIADSTGFVAEDVTSGAPIRVRLLNAVYPVRSGLARVVLGAPELRVSGFAADTLHTAAGQSARRIAGLRLTNPADAATGAAVRVDRLELDLTDGHGGHRHHLTQWLARVLVRSSHGVHLDRAVTVGDSTSLALELGNTIPVPAGSSLDVEVLADFRTGISNGYYVAFLEDSTRVSATQANSGEPMPTRFDTTPLCAGTVRIETPATSVLASGRPAFPSAAAVGSMGLHALTTVFRHPGSDGTSSVRVDSLELELLDAGRHRLSPSLYFSRLVLTVPGSAPVVLNTLPVPAAPFKVALGAWRLLAQGVDSVRITVDLSPSSPLGSIELVSRPEAWDIVESTLGGRVTATPDEGATLPLGSGLLRLDTPARRLTAEWQGLLPPAVAADGSWAPVASLVLRNTAPAGTGDIAVGSLRLVANDETGAAVPIGRYLESIAADDGELPWASSAALGPDSTGATLSALAPLLVRPGDPANVRIRARARAGAPAGHFRVGIEQPGIGVLQPTSALLVIAIEPEAGSSFPMWSQVSAVTPGGLEASWSNFPNPFAGDREPTTFVYELATPSRVTLRLWTLRGELVRTIVDGVRMGAGLRQSDRWDGVNGAGRKVVNGVYVAELIVEPDGAPRSRLLRKVAVVR